MILPLVFFGDPRLRKKATRVESVTPDVIQLVQDMIETLDSYSNGVGLAAPQVGSPLKIFIIRPVLQRENGESYLGEVEVYINPHLSSPSSETESLPEGCLSVPGIHKEVIRPLRIHVEALDLSGKTFSMDVEGFKAREIMHENDHLNGVLFIDRIDPSVRKEIEPLLREIKKKYKPS